MKSGIDRLIAEPALRAPLRGKRVALLAHPASVTENLTHTLDALAACSDMTISAAFGPQHGLRGDKQDNMIESPDFNDPVHGIPVFSLYGDVRKPTDPMMDAFDVILVDNGSSEARTRGFLSRFESRKRYQIVNCPGEFNFSRLCNSGAARSSSDYLLFLNNDTEVDSPTWLEELIRPAMDQQVGVVGATLLYPNRTIQHAGLFPLDNDLWMHVHRGQSADSGTILANRYSHADGPR